MLDATTDSHEWLHAYIVDAISRRLCVRYTCTTCGARDFKNGLARRVNAPADQPFPFLSPDSARSLATAVRGLTRARNADGQYEEAVRSVLCLIWYALGREGDAELSGVLHGTWSGYVLDSMKAHSAAVNAERERRALEQSPERVQERRDAKRLLKQQRHAERLLAKRERDRLWHERR